MANGAGTEGQSVKIPPFIVGGPGSAGQPVKVPPFVKTGKQTGK